MGIMKVWSPPSGSMTKYIISIKYILMKNNMPTLIRWKMENYTSKPTSDNCKKGSFLFTRFKYTVFANCNVYRFYL